MKNLKFTTLILLLVTLFFASCKKDACDDVNCQNGSSCDDGKCICISGYEGDNCENEERTKFLGIWNGTSVCEGDSELLSISVNSTADLNKVVLSVDGAPINADISGSDINIPLQTIDDSQISGSGIVNGTNMTITFLVVDLIDNESWTCIFNVTK